MAAGNKAGWSVEAVLSGFAAAPALLSATSELLAAPDDWARGGLAFAADGRPVASAAPDAVRFCIAGALLRAATDTGVDEPLAYLIDDDPEDAAEARTPQAPTAVRASLLCAVLGHRRENAPLGPYARGPLVTDAFVTLVDEAHHLQTPGARPRLLVAIATINDQPDTTLEQLRADLALATAIASIARGALEHPESGWRLRAFLHATLPTITANSGE